jgi:hypothetical protein
MLLSHRMMGSSLVDTLLKARLVRSSGFSWRVVSLSYALVGGEQHAGCHEADYAWWARGAKKASCKWTGRELAAARKAPHRSNCT